GRDALADGARVVARARDRRDDRAAVGVVEHEELADRALGALDAALIEVALEMQHLHELAPDDRRVFDRRPQQAVIRDGEHARRVLGTLEIPPGPEEVFGVTGEHQTSAPSAASTHVSFEPPPCDEFTTSDPFGSATRVSPPGITSTRSPESTN